MGDVDDSFFLVKMVEQLIEYFLGAVSHNSSVETASDVIAFTISIGTNTRDRKSIV